MPCSQNPKPLFSKAFTEKYMKGETQAAEDAGRYWWYRILKRVLCAECKASCKTPYREQMLMMLNDNDSYSHTHSHRHMLCSHCQYQGGNNSTFHCSRHYSKYKHGVVTFKSFIPKYFRFDDAFIEKSQCQRKWGSDMVRQMFLKTIKHLLSSSSSSFQRKWTLWSCGEWEWGRYGWDMEISRGVCSLCTPTVSRHIDTNIMTSSGNT